MWNYINGGIPDEEVLQASKFGIQLVDNKYYFLLNTDNCHYEIVSGADICNMDISNVRYGKYYSNTLNKPYGTHDIFIDKDVFSIYYRGYCYELSISNKSLMYNDSIILPDIEHIAVSSYGVYYDKFYIELVLKSYSDSNFTRAFFYINTKTGLFQDTYSGKRLSKRLWVFNHLSE